MIPTTLILDIETESDSKAVGIWLAKHLKCNYERTLVLLDTKDIYRFTVTCQPWFALKLLKFVEKLEG